MVIHINQNIVYFTTASPRGMDIGTTAGPARVAVRVQSTPKRPRMRTEPSDRKRSHQQQHASPIDTDATSL